MGISIFSIFYLIFVNKSFIKKIFQIILLVLLPLILIQYAFNLESQKNDRETNRILKTFKIILDSNNYNIEKNKKKKINIIEKKKEYN